MLTGKHGKIEVLEAKTGLFNQNKRIRVRSLLWMILIVFLGNGLNAQIYEVVDYKKRKAAADSLINELKEGVLVIRLRTKHKKLIALNQVLKNPNMSKRKKRLAKKRIETTINERDNFNQEMIAAFHDIYDFTPFYFIHDTSSVQLKNGIKQGIFLNKELEIDPSITFPDKYYFMLSDGSTKKETGILYTGLIITSPEGDLPDRPFPHFFGIKTRFGAMFSFLPGINRRVVGKDIVENIQRRFSRSFLERE